MVKRKSTSQNPFRYVSFTEQMARINGDATTWKMALPSVNENYEMFFLDAVSRSKDMDFGSYFKDFLDDIPLAEGELRTYAQLLHHQKLVFDALVKHLSIRNSTSLATILEITIAFARDLREDLKPYLWELFDTVIGVIENCMGNAEVLQAAFRALAIFLKLQWRFVVKELRRTFMCFCGLFSNKRGYIRRFAAEAFAFLFRKSSAIGKVAIFLTERAKEDDTKTLADGVSQLYFNALKGVMHQFHSSAPQVLSEIIDASLNIPDASTMSVAVAILEGTMMRCIAYTKKDFSLPIFNVIMQSASSLQQKFISSSHVSSSSEKTIFLSRLLLIWVTATKKDATIVPSDFLKVILDQILVEKWEPTDSTLKLLSQAILRFHEVSEYRLQIVSLFDTVVNRSERESALLLYSFFSELIDIAMFDIFLMPAVGNFSAKVLSCRENGLTLEVLKFYSTLCSKRRGIGEVIGEKNSFFDVSNHSAVRDRVVEILEDTASNGDEHSINVAYAACIYPWLWRKVEIPHATNALVRILHRAFSGDYSSFSSHVALLVANAIVHTDKCLLIGFDIDELLRFLRLSSCQEIALHVFCMLLPFTGTFQSEDHLKLSTKIAEELLPFFGHWKSSVRASALKILDLFDLPLCLSESLEIKDEIPEESLFKILLEVEGTPLTIHDYRDRLMLLRRLSYGLHKKHLPKNFSSALETVPLRVIIAQLYENFTIYWPPLFEIIQTYALGLDIDIFWPIFYSFLVNANKKIACKEKSEEEKHTNLDDICGYTENAAPNYMMFRLQLFKMLKTVAVVAERRSKFLSPLLIDLFRNEYTNADGQGKICQDISFIGKEHADGSVELAKPDEDELASSEEDRLEEDDLTGPPVKKRKKAKRLEALVASPASEKRLLKKTLVALLEVFSAFKSPKSIYMSNEIRLLYDELLLVGDSDVQKTVLQCIFGLRYKYLNPYRENFENLVEERTFLDELVRFGLDPQNSVIAEEHRNNVVPILMRLLYGKLQTHVSRNIVTRRAAIFRFLAGCKSNELDSFLSLLFSPLIETMKCVPGFDASSTSLTAVCQYLSEHFDPVGTVPLVKLKGCLNGLSHVIKKLSPSLEEKQQSFLYRLCVSAAVIVTQALLHPAVYPKYLKLLKELRSLVFLRFKEYFFAFQARFFNADEINALFLYVVGPTCNSTSRGEKLIAPFNLLRLFASWAQVPLLFNLFRVWIPSEKYGSENSVLAVMFNTLSSAASGRVAKECILDAILNLLTLSDEERPSFPLEVTVAKVKRIEGVNFGTCLVLGELQTLLEFIYNSLPAASEKKKVNMKHLEIINRLSEFVEDENLAEKFACALLGYIGAGAVRNEETLRSMLFTVSRLVYAIKNPVTLLPNLIKLQSTLKPKECRLALNSILTGVSASPAVNGRKLSVLLRHIADLDAWDRTKVDEPDFGKRHAAFVHLNKALDVVDALDVSVLQMLAHNYFYSITESNDLSIRDVASTSFRKLIEYVGCSALSESEKTATCERHFITLILKGLRSETELVRLEFIPALVSLIIAFPLHKQLSHLSQIRNTDEVDLDFFDNLSHLQLHRRQRALRRLSDSLERGEVKIPSEVMLRFLLPLLQPYIVEIRSESSAVSDEAVRLLKIIMSVAPWKKYWPMLEYYLNRLQNAASNQKATLRIIVALIEAFHFDVSFNEELVRDFEVNLKSKVKTSEVTVERPNNDLTANADNDAAEDTEVDYQENTVVEAVRDSISSKIFNYLLPRLKDCATGKDVSAHSKAQNGKYYDEDEIIQRAPVALATVKLLQKMPSKIMDQHLHGVVLKLCDLLMSRSIHVRDSARKTLIAVVDALGPKYLPFVIKEIKVNLLRGYQERLKSGDLDSCLDGILEVCKLDLFSDVTEEKSVTGITKDVPEAKGNRTYETYSFLGRFASFQSMGLAVAALKDVINSRPTAKVIQNVGQLLKNYALGLSINQGVDPLHKLTFSFHMIKDHVDEVLATIKPKEESLVEQDIRKKASCLLLEKEPARVGVITAKTSQKSRMFVFVEFGLRILAASLKAKHFDTESAEDIARLEPFVPLVAKCLELKYDKIVSMALRSFLFLLKFPLPSLRNQIQAFIDRLYILLAEYAALGAAGNKGMVLELNHLLFQAFTHMINDAPTLVLTPARLQLLLNYLEADIMDTHKQATAFSLFKAIINRKLQDPKIVNLINCLCETSIISGLPHIQIQCRQVIAHFVGIHPQSKKPKFYVEFFLNQLEYEYENGRVSAVEMLNVLFDNMSQRINDQYSMLAFVKMATRLINDESPKCRRLVALAIRKLMSSISDTKLSDIFLAIRDWLQSTKEQNKRVAMLMLVEYGEVVGENLSGKLLDDLVPLFVSTFKLDILEGFAESTVTTIFDCLTVLIRKCSEGFKFALRSSSLNDLIDSLEEFARSVQSVAVHLSLSKLCGEIFSLVEVTQCGKIVAMSHEFVDRMCWQLKSAHLTVELAEQASKNLVYLSDAFATEDELKWLCGKLSSICKFEVVKLPKEELRRMSVFKMVAVLVMRATDEFIPVLLDSFFPYLYRELNSKTRAVDEAMSKLAVEVCEIIKEKVGHEVYIKKYNEVRKTIAEKAEFRKRLRKEEAITDPVAAALKKQKKNLKKTAGKKRKHNSSKPCRGKQ